MTAKNVGFFEISKQRGVKLQFSVFHITTLKTSYNDFQTISLIFWYPFLEPNASSLSQFCEQLFGNCSIGKYQNVIKNIARQS